MGCQARSPSSSPASGGSCRTKSGARSAMAGCAGGGQHHAPWSDGVRSRYGLAGARGLRLPAESEATVEFKVPLIGGAVESVVGGLLVQNISFMQRFTTEWSTEHV